MVSVAVTIGVHVSCDEPPECRIICRPARESPPPSSCDDRVFGICCQIWSNKDLECSESPQVLEFFVRNPWTVMEDHTTGLKKRDLIESRNRFVARPTRWWDRPVRSRRGWVTGPHNFGSVDEMHAGRRIQRFLAWEITGGVSSAPDYRGRKNNRD